MRDTVKAIYGGIDASDPSGGGRQLETRSVTVDNIRRSRQKNMLRIRSLPFKISIADEAQKVEELGKKKNKVTLRHHYIIQVPICQDL
jgi:hypothetical protein